jgi:mRNA-degrading endonuclease RelE of RelBE toxin-antitoxin system
MRGDPPSQRLTVIWSPEARSDLRAIDRETAVQILHCLDHYLSTRTGDVKKLKPPLYAFRLRCGDYRIFFDLSSDNTVNVLSIRNRRDAYR